MGYSTKMTYILHVPPYVVAAIVSVDYLSYGYIQAKANTSQWMFGAGALNDRIRMRGPTLVVQALVIICGSCIMAFAKPAGVRCKLSQLPYSTQGKPSF